MERKHFDAMACPIARSLERVGEWWSILILRDAFYGLSRFDEFEKSLKIAPNMLTRRLAGLVEALLDLSRIRLGRMQLVREDLDVSALVREVAAPYQADLDLAHGSSIRVVAPEPVRASLDRVRIEQVLGNLIGNAVKFGEGKPVEIRVEHTGGAVRIEVADSGVGIEADQAERIFGRFERAAPAHHYPGLGLGLYVAREIVEAHGGRIRARGEPGKGAVFAVEIPT